MKSKDNLRAIYSAAIIIILFIIATIIAQKNLALFEQHLKDSIPGMIIYVLLMIVETVLAPLTALPIIAIAANIWGPILTALLSILGWAVGSLISFWIGREYGFPIVKHLISEKKIKKIESLIPERNIFLGVVLLRIAIPVDILSYVLGMFTRIKWRTYTLATIIGITPLAFLFAFIGKVPFVYQILAALIAGIILILIVIYSITRKKPSKRRITKTWDKFFK